MNPTEPPQINDRFSTIELIERPSNTEEQGFLSWWHRIAAPSMPAPTASLREREAWRRGKYISNTLLAEITLMVLLIIFIAVPFLHFLIPNFLITLAFLGLSTFFNKRGNVIVSGIIVVLVLDAGLAGALLSSGQMTTFLLPFLDLLVIPELFAASLLPPYFVFFDMLLHIGFSLCVLTFLTQKDAAFLALLQNPGTFVDALAKPVSIQVVAAVIAFTWMRSVTRSVERADRATSIAMLERNIASQAQREAEQKRQLENEIKEIIKVHTQVANGNYEARVSLRQGNILWPVAGSLNNLITRLRGLLAESQRLQRMQNATLRFFQARTQAQNGPIAWQATGTPIDKLVQQHNMFAALDERQEQKRY